MRAFTGMKPNSTSNRVSESFIIRSLVMIFTVGFLVVPFTLTKALVAGGYDIGRSASLLYFTAVAYPLAAIVECLQFLSGPSVRVLLPGWRKLDKAMKRPDIVDVEDPSEKTPRGTNESETMSDRHSRREEDAELAMQESNPKEDNASKAQQQTKKSSQSRISDSSASSKGYVFTP